MGLFFSSKKPVTPTTSSVSGSTSSAHSLDRNSPGKIIPRELPFVKNELRRGMGKYKAEKIMEGLQSNMDSDGHFGGRNISADESKQALDYLKKGRFNNLSSGDIEKAKDILGKFE